MADAAVSFLLENVSQLLNREVGLVRGVGDEIKLLKVELALIRRFLSASKGKRDLVKEVVDEIRSMAQEAEDVIDTFVVDLALHKRRNMLDRYIRKIGHAFMLRGVATKIRTIKNQIAVIYGSQEKYGIEINDDSKSEENLRRESLHSRRRRVEEVEVVSFLEDAKIVMDTLTTSNMHLDVVSIIGMGGLGKTTLSKKIYNNIFMKGQFPCRAWVNVSQEFQPKHVLFQILQSLTQPTERIHEMSEEDLAKEVRNNLQDKMYLIVLDDVWTPEAWTRIKESFPDTENGSRILITSRIKEVAAHASTTPPYLLPLLNKDDSWELLSKKAFRGAACPPELESNGRKIAEKCQGLPLALVVVGGLLATRDQSTLIWSQMVANISWYLEKNPKSFNDVLALSYQELPSHLKPCFLYLGVYPEDYEMSARQLIRLWVAEGLIEKDTRRMPEDIADEYLQDLADRSLIMVVKRRTDIGIKSCIIHDPLRDLCIAEAVEDNFFVVHNDNGFIKSASSNRPRRISFQNDISKYNSTPDCCDSSLLRSLLWFDGNKYQFGRLIFKDFLLARVLQFGKSSLPVHSTKYPTPEFHISLSPEFKKLVLLRYLSIRSTTRAVIPSFICNLPNLQTLDLKETTVDSLGDHFWNMQELRHFFVHGPCELSPSHLPSHVKTMLNLQTLSGVGSNFIYMIDCKIVFPNMRKLQIVESEQTCYAEVTGSKPDIDSIQTLKVILGSHVLSDAGALSGSRLTKLTLSRTNLSNAQFCSLSLPNLEILKLLSGSIFGWEPRLLTNKSLLKLQILYMVGLEGLARWWVDEECLSNLKCVFISRCRHLIKVPESLKASTAIRHVKVSQCTLTLENRFRALGFGENTRLEFENNQNGTYYP